MPGRFQFSFPQRRHHGDPWFRIGNLDVTTTVLVSLLCALTIFVYAADSDLLRHLVMDPDRVLSGQIWRLVTWPFVSVPEPSFIWTILRIVLFWWFGRELEAQIGRRRFAILLTVVVLGSGVIAASLNVPIWGLRYVELAAFVLFIANNPRIPFFFSIPGWVVAAVFIGAEFLDLVGARAYDLMLVLASSLVLALLVGRMYGLAADQAWIPNLARRSSGARRTSSPKPARGPKRAKKSRSATPVVVSGPWAPPSPSTSADQVEVDRLLDKISAQGMDSLSSDEKRRLKEASERIRRERG